MKKTVLASGNAGKLKELTAILAPLGLELIAQSALGIDSPPETGTTFLENALIKARHAARASGLPALADDSGIEVDALDGRPGVRSARFAGEGASDADNLHKLLAELHDVPTEFRQARYHCVIAFVRRHDDSQPIVAHGTWEGRIALEPRGSGGFGYDPIFLPAPKPAGHRGGTRPGSKERNQPPCSGVARVGRRCARRARSRNDTDDAHHTRHALRAGRALRCRQDITGEGAARAHARSADVHFPHHATAAAYRGARTGVLLHHGAGVRALVADGQFLEHARVFDNLYGTARAPVETHLAQGGDIVLEIDWQGARQVRSAMPDCVTIFILPPSREALEKRLRSRATDSPQVIARRLRDAVSDMSHWREFDYVVVNDDFEKAVADLVAIVSAHGERVPRTPAVAAPRSGESGRGGATGRRPARAGSAAGAPAGLSTPFGLIVGNPQRHPALLHSLYFTYPYHGPYHRRRLSAERR